MKNESRNRAWLERQRFIDAMLDYYGEFNRYHLIDYFGISQPQASNDIKDYQATAPDNVYYNASARRYKCTSKFRRVYP